MRPKEMKQAARERLFCCPNPAKNIYLHDAMETLRLIAWDNANAAWVKVKASDNSMLVMDYLTAIAIGAQSGHAFRYSFGRSINVDNVLVDLWEGPTPAYVFPASAQQMTVKSSSAADASAGTGVRKVHIHYLDANYAEQSETVTLNGTNAVNTVATDILRINGVHSWEVGSGGVPAGNISVQNTAGTVTYGYMGAGLNVALQSCFTVPSGKKMYIKQWLGGSGSAGGNHFTQIMLRATSHYGVLLQDIFLVHDMIPSQDGAMVVDFPIAVEIPAMADIKVSAISDSATANVTAVGRLSGWIE